MGERRVVYRFSVGKGEGMNHLKDPGINGRILLRWVFRKWRGSMHWIILAQDKDRPRELVNAVMNLRAPYNAGNFFTG